MNTLKRYRKHYDLEPQRNLGKQELVEVSKHELEIDLRLSLNTI